MYQDYSNWETFEYKLSSLNLDLQNPRINYYGKSLNQNQIMKFLIENEGVYELAKKISEEGYYVGEEPIICIEGDKKIVLEGNRRVAALKLLQNPKKYLPETKANILLKNISDNNFSVNSKRCYIAPNRILANPIIYSRHRGETLKKWKTGNQYSFVADMYYKDGLSLNDICELLNETPSRVKKYLKAYNLFFEAQQLYLEENGEFIEISNFDITNLERFYDYKEGQEFLGIDFSEEDGSLNIKIPVEEFNKRLLYIFQELLTSAGFSREFNNESQKKEYIESLRQNPLFDFGVGNNQNTKKGKTSENRKNLEEEKKKTNPRRKTRTSSNTPKRIIPRDCYIYFENEKLNSLFYELKSLPIEREYSFAILLRTYLEQVLYHYIEKKNLTEDFQRKIIEERRKNTEAKINTLTKYLKGEYSINEEIDTEKIMEILKFNDNKGYVNSSLKTMLDYIKKQHLAKLICDTSKLKSISDYLENVKQGLDLAVHNIDYIIDFNVNKRAWNTLEPLFVSLSDNLNNE